MGGFLLLAVITVVLYKVSISLSVSFVLILSCLSLKVSTIILGLWVGSKGSFCSWKDCFAHLNRMVHEKTKSKKMLFYLGKRLCSSTLRGVRGADFAWELKDHEHAQGRGSPLRGETCFMVLGATPKSPCL